MIKLFKGKPDKFDPPPRPFVSVAKIQLLDEEDNIIYEQSMRPIRLCAGDRLTINPVTVDARDCPTS